MQILHSKKNQDFDEHVQCKYCTTAGGGDIVLRSYVVLYSNLMKFTTGGVSLSHQTPKKCGSIVAFQEGTCHFLYLGCEFIPQIFKTQIFFSEKI